ncbi:hypothetical protein ACFQWB_09865 [Paenibacillus thermoaerophilus]|uniref:Uncharacterized protein n=1 Tax=Paenibacillus thermoaerophilus TaxID=1215385 RepID=A0ABW2V258_9BACL|nr:WD40 repeat domain-containing protein [Paenibacillus thermoaerophilus]TMV11150.1 WD40 repeat domain-containing protein [Paenibacillus thermoaerophilus]
MNNRLERVRPGPPVDLGEVVVARLGQAACIGTRCDGSPELYIAANGAPATFYAVDLRDGSVRYAFPIPHSEAVWGMTLAPDGFVYFSGTEDGMLYRYLPEERRTEALGVSPADPWVWDIASSPDGCVYGATYPNAKAFEYDPKRGTFRDLGRMSEDQFYVRGIAATERFVYAGIGSEMRLVRWDRRTGERRELRLEGYSGRQGFVDRIWPAEDGSILFVSVDQAEVLVYEPEAERILNRFAANDFVSPASPADGAYYFVSEGALYAYSPESNAAAKQAALPSSPDQPKIKCMRWIAEQDGSFRLAIVTAHADYMLYDPVTKSVTEGRTQIPAKPVQLQSLESDGAGKLYIGGYHRSLTIYDTATRRVELSIPNFPQIEGIGFSNGKAYFGTYTKARVFRYDPEREAAPGSSPSSNPAFLFAVGHHQDRPFAIASGGGKVYIGTIADYGLLTGAIAVYDEESGEHEVFPGIVPNQSVVGLAYRDGLLYGGTTNWGGFGVEPSETEAKLFVWDVRSRKLLHSFTPDIPGIDMPPRMIGELSFGPDGLLWGAVDGTIFAMEPDGLRVVKSKTICPSEYKYSHIRPYFLRWGPQGLLVTTLARKLIVIDPQTLDHAIWDETPLALMTVGADGRVYYNAGSHLMMREVIFD